MFILIIGLMASQQNGNGNMLGTVYFDAGDTTLTAASMTVLRGIADRIRAEPNLRIDVYGYTDNTGSANVNTAVSKRRAELVKQYLSDILKEHGDRIQTSGMGSRNPVAPNETEKGRKKNRRVEIVVREPDAVLTWFENDVKVQPPFLRPRWLDPSPHYYLYHDYMVTTGKMSRAYIQYPNESVLRMDEYAMVVIHRMDMEREDERFVKDIEMQNGSLKTMLNNETGPKDTTVDVSGVILNDHALQNKTDIDKKMKDLIAAYEGDTAVVVPQEEPVVETEEDTIVQPVVRYDRPAGLGAGVFAGEPAGISLKAWRDTKHAVDVKVGWSFPDEIVYVIGDYLVHFPQPLKDRFWYPYVGVGVQIRIDKENDDWRVNPGIRIGGGVEFIHRGFGVFADIYPEIELIHRTPISLSGGIGIRYYFID